MCRWLSPFLSLRSVCTGPKGEMARSQALAPAGPAQGGVARSPLWRQTGLGALLPRGCSNAACYEEANDLRPPGCGSHSKVNSVMEVGLSSWSSAFEIWLKSAEAEVDAGFTRPPVWSCRAELA